MEPGTFATFIRRIREGDQKAAEELVRRYETTIRVAVRARLHDGAMRRQFDSMDICQSVLASFFFRAAAGQFELSAPEDLAKLLVTMTRNKVISQARKQRSQVRDVQRVLPTGLENVEVAAGTPSPSRHVEGRELLARVRALLTEEERKVAELRGLGRGWAEIAAELGGTAEARRKQLTRALDRVAPELGLDEGDLLGEE
jgi:RNA polymerase sigma factor (sigma-70 family)